MRILEEKMSELSKYGFQYDLVWFRYIYEGVDLETKDEDEYIEKNYKTLYVDNKTRRLYAYNDYNEEEIPLKKEYYRDLEEAGLIEHTTERKLDDRFEQIKLGG